MKNAIVTGAGRGIGLAIAERLASQGFRVTLIDASAERLQDAVDGFATRGYELTPIAGDIMEPMTIRKAIAAAKAGNSRIDGIVNNVGIFTPELNCAEDVEFGAWRRVLEVNVGGTFLMCQQVGREMITTGGGGSIVNIASIYGMRALDARLYHSENHEIRYDDSAYHVSKAAVIQMTKTLSVSWARHGIRVNSVSPGPIDTASNEEFIQVASSDQVFSRIAERVPMHRHGRPSEIANAVSFLLSDNASFITGANLIVDGGWTCL